MRICLDYKDSAKIVDPQYNVYGSESVGEEVNIKCLFIQNTGWSHSSNNSNIDSNASAYLDISSDFVVKNANRLEGMLLIANQFGFEDEESWYRIISVNVNQDKLLCNKIDNIYVSLKKTERISDGI